MRRARPVPVLMLLLGIGLLLSACTFQGALKEDFYRPRDEAGPKHPFKIAVLVDDRAKAITFDAQSGMHVYHMNMDFRKALGRAFQQELATVFDQVTVVEDSSKAAGNDLLATAYVDIGASGGMSAMPQFDTKLDLTIKELQGRIVLAKESQNKRVAGGSWLSSGKFQGCNILTAFTFFLLSPVTIPCQTDAVGESILEDVSKELPNMVRLLVSDVQSDGRFAAFVRGGTGGSAVASVSAAKPVPTSDVDAVPTTVPPRKRPAYAVVVGIEQYRQGLPKADFSDHDARIVRDHLVKGLGYQEENVVLLLNDHATKTDMEKYFEKWLENRVDQGDTVFVYFSGHGAPNPKTGDAYLVPYDGDPAYIDTTGYPLKRLYESLGKLPAKEVVVLLDSCFSGAGGRSVLAKGARPMGLSVEKAMIAGGKTVVMAASSGDQISSTYTTKSHGLLTYFFLKGLQGEGDQDKDGVLDLKELFDYVRPQVERVARREFNNEQTPQLLGSPDLLGKGIRLSERMKP
jgi:hypothetical protein